MSNDIVRSTNQCSKDSKFPASNMSIDVEGGASLGLMMRVRTLNKKYAGTILAKQWNFHGISLTNSWVWGA